MEDEALIKPDELEWLLAEHTSGEVATIRLWAECCARFNALSRDKRVRGAEELSAAYAPKLGRFSTATLYRKARAFKHLGVRALADRRGKANPCLRDKNPQFVRFFRNLVLQNQRSATAAVRDLFLRLRSGEEIPGYGAWQAIWQAEHPGSEVPEVCPYAEGVLLPKGWSLSNLLKYKPSKWALTATRTGTLAASNLLPMVPRTRAGLKRGQIVEVDDMWHDVKVRFGNNPAERCIELALLDVATGYRVGLLKPIRRREDGTRETVLSRMMPYLLGYWIVVLGYAPEGALLCGEHNTASLSKRLEEALDIATQGKVRFAAGGLLSHPLAHGLWEGKPRGNFRFKARLEGSHALLHSALGSVSGQVGYTRDNAPENLYAKDKAEAALLRACEKLAERDPELPSRLAWPYIPYEDYSKLVATALEAINARTEHALEGWKEQGFITGAWRLGEREPWRDMAELEGFEPALAEAVMAQLQSNPRLTKVRRLSPAEAWRKRERDVIRAPRSAMPLILGEELAMHATCSERLELRVKDPAICLEGTVPGVVQDVRGRDVLLERGQAYSVWINPLEPSLAYVAKDERFVGTATLLQATHQDDLEGVTENLKIRAKAQALERAQVLPLAQAQALKLTTAKAWNEALLSRARTQGGTLGGGEGQNLDALPAPPIAPEAEEEEEGEDKLDLLDFINRPEETPEAPEAPEGTDNPGNLD